MLIAFKTLILTDQGSAKNATATRCNIYALLTHGTMRVLKDGEGRPSRDEVALFNMSASGSDNKWRGTTTDISSKTQLALH
jgi:hypothetical protein